MGLKCARPHPLFDPLFELSFWFPLLLPLRLPSLFCPFCCPLLLPASIQSDEERRVQERLPRIMSVLRQVISALVRQHCCGIRHLSKDWHSLMPSCQDDSQSSNLPVFWLPLLLPFCPVDCRRLLSGPAC